MIKNSRGFVLFASLLWIFLSGLLVFSLYEAIILQQKLLSQHYLYQQLFSLANNGLNYGEQTLHNQELPEVGVTVKQLAKFNMKIHEAVATITYYQIISRANKKKLSVTLISTYAIITPSTIKLPDIATGRQSWNEIVSTSLSS